MNTRKHSLQVRECFLQLYLFLVFVLVDTSLQELLADLKEFFVRLSLKGPKIDNQTRRINETT
jgi:hypothetical protein